MTVWRRAAVVTCRIWSRKRENNRLMRSFPMELNGVSGGFCTQRPTLTVIVRVITRRASGERTDSTAEKWAFTTTRQTYRVLLHACLAVFFHVFAAFYNAIEPPRFLNQSFYAINRYSFVLLHFFNFPDIGPKTCEISDDAMTRSHIYRMIIKLCHNQIVVASNYW